MRSITYLFIFLVSFSLACETAENRTQKKAEPQKNSSSSEIRNVSVVQAQAATSSGEVRFIDVRTPEEFAEGHARNTANLPLDSLPARLEELSRDEPVYLICRTGSRSTMAAEILKKNGFTQVYNVEGGTTDWISAGLPTER